MTIGARKREERPQRPRHATIELHQSYIASHPFLELSTQHKLKKQRILELASHDSDLRAEEEMQKRRESREKEKRSWQGRKGQERTKAQRGPLGQTGLGAPKYDINRDTIRTCRCGNIAISRKSKR